MYLEDTDLSWRARLLGYRCVAAHGSRVYHQFTMRLGAGKVFYLERNRWLMLLKNYHARTLVWLLPALWLSEMVTWAYAALAGPAHIRAKLRAYWWIMSHAGAIRGLRRAVQGARQVDDRAILLGFDYRLAVDHVSISPVARLGQEMTSHFFRQWRRLTLAALGGAVEKHGACMVVEPASASPPQGA